MIPAAILPPAYQLQLLLPLLPLLQTFSCINTLAFVNLTLRSASFEPPQNVKPCYLFCCCLQCLCRWTRLHPVNFKPHPICFAGASASTAQVLSGAGVEWCVRGLRRLLALHPRVTFPACLPSPPGSPARFPPADLNASLAITHLRGAWCPSWEQMYHTKDHFAMIPHLPFACLACDFWPMTQLAVHVPAPSMRRK